MGATLAFGGEHWFPTVGGALGLFTAQLRFGASYLHGGPVEDGFVARLEARPVVLTLPCGEIALFGNFAAGYRWPIEPPRPDGLAGPALFVMPAFEAGPAWLRKGCTKRGAPDVPLERAMLLGGTVSLGVDF